jgi:hypothetical protein
MWEHRLLCELYPPLLGERERKFCMILLRKKTKTWDVCDNPD